MARTKTKFEAGEVGHSVDCTAGVWFGMFDDEGQFHGQKIQNPVLAELIRQHTPNVRKSLERLAGTMDMTRAN